MVAYSASLSVLPSQTNLHASHLLTVPITNVTTDKQVTRKLSTMHETIVLYNKARHSNLANKTTLMLYNCSTCHSKTLIVPHSKSKFSKLSYISKTKSPDIQVGMAHISSKAFKRAL